MSLELSKVVSLFLKRVCHREGVVCGKRVNSGARKGLEIPVEHKIMFDKI